MALFKANKLSDDTPWSISESISLLLSEHYSNQKPPRILLVPTGLEEGVMQWLSDKRGSKVELVPKREIIQVEGPADRNAEIQLERSLSRSSGNIEYRAASDSAELLGLTSWSMSFVLTWLNFLVAIGRCFCCVQKR